MGMTITNFWKLFDYGVTIYHYKKFMGIRELLERLVLDCFNNPFTTDTRNLAKSMPLIDEVYAGEKVSTLHALHFSSFASHST